MQTYGQRRATIRRCAMADHVLVYETVVFLVSPVVAPANG